MIGRHDFLWALKRLERTWPSCAIRSINGFPIRPKTKKRQESVSHLFLYSTKYVTADVIKVYNAFRYEIETRLEINLIALKKESR